MAGIIPLILIGGAAGIIALLMKGSAKADDKKIEEKKENAAKKVDTVLKQTGADKLVATAEKTKNPVMLAAAAKKVEAAGQPQVAAAINQRAKGMLVESNTVMYPSPSQTISAEAWTKFVNCSKSGTANAVTAGFSLGLFGFGARRLVDLKVMKNPRQETFKGKKVWNADWIPPWNLQKFLADSAFQYQCFLKSMNEYAGRIVKDGLKFPMTVDGIKVTMSGALALMHKAGYSGAKKWLTNAKDRQKFSATTAWFQKCNGIF